MHIAVAPAGAAFAPGIIGSPEPVPTGGQASWFARVAPEPADLASDELRALPLPSLTTRLAGPHTLTPGSEAVAPGWGAASVGGDGSISSTAGADALVGNALAQSFPRPLPPVSQGTGGDGHVPILVGTKVFAFYHHSFPTSATCVDRATGELCPGYPKQLNVGTTDINGPGVVVGSKIWWHPRLASSFAQRASLGLYCWDADTDTSCGMTIVDRVGSTGEPGGSAPVLAGGKIWFGGTTGKLYCLEPATGAPCATPSVATGLSAGDSVHGQRRPRLARVRLAPRRRIGGVRRRGRLERLPGLGSAEVLRRRLERDQPALRIGSRDRRLRHRWVGRDVRHRRRPRNPDADHELPAATDGYYAVTLEAETGTRTLVARLGRSATRLLGLDDAGPLHRGQLRGGRVAGAGQVYRTPSRARTARPSTAPASSRSATRARSSRWIPPAHHRAPACAAGRAHARSTCAASAAMEPSVRHVGVT